jgi:GNAT superfamily N-acetyltransferase
VATWFTLAHTSVCARRAVLAHKWRAPVLDDEVVELVVAHGGNPVAGWWDQIRPHSLGWVTARATTGQLIGFVNVAWDGGDHAFLLDTKTRQDRQRAGIGTRLVRVAAEHASKAGCEWLHVDFEDGERLAAFYFDSCGFRPVNGGVIHLHSLEL